MSLSVDEETGSDRRDLSILLVLTIISLILGFATGIAVWTVLHPSRLIAFLTAFGASFALFIVLTVGWSLVAMVKRRFQETSEE